MTKKKKSNKQIFLDKLTLDDVVFKFHAPTKEIFGDNFGLFDSDGTLRFASPFQELLFVKMKELGWEDCVIQEFIITKVGKPIKEKPKRSKKR